jgi:hypothetical protein
MQHSPRLFDTSEQRRRIQALLGLVEDLCSTRRPALTDKTKLLGGAVRRPALAAARRATRRNAAGGATDISFRRPTRLDKRIISAPKILT